MISAPGEPITTVGLGEPIDPANAPRPSNESERLLFRQLYETLVRADCRGRLVPALAASWTLDDDGRTWIVTLRHEARFADGTPVTAADVSAGWRRDRGGDELHPAVSRLVESVNAIAAQALAIRLRSRRTDAPWALAAADLAVARFSTGARWPLGTRTARIAEADTRPLAASGFTLTRDNLPAVRFLVARGDLRDLLDQGVDLLLTHDGAVLEYAATLAQFQSVPLAWQRSHLLLIPWRSRAAPASLDHERQALANDAVRGEARAASGPFWWETLPDCGIAVRPSGNRSTPLPRIVYDAADAVGRDLAERFVALTRAAGAAPQFLDGRTFQRATGLTGEALAVARRRGADAGYIVSIDARPLDPCRELQALLEIGQWVDPAAIVPLVDTRVQAIVRRGRAGVFVEWDGGLVVAGSK